VLSSRRGVEKSRDMFHVEHSSPVKLTVMHCQVCTVVFPLGISSASELNKWWQNGVISWGSHPTVTFLVHHLAAVVI
jgi:hypothetical protein